MLKLKLQYFGHVMRRVDSLEKTLMLGKIEGRRKRGWQRMRWLHGITNKMDMNAWVNSRNWWWTEKPGELQAMGSQRVRHDWATELNWNFYWDNHRCTCNLNKTYIETMLCILHPLSSNDQHFAKYLKMLNSFVTAKVASIPMFISLSPVTLFPKP